MGLVLSLAVKSLLVAGATLILLRLMRNSSAAQRSFLAHAGLGALLIMPLVALLLPALEVETGLLGTDQPAAAALETVPKAAIPVMSRIAAAPFQQASLNIDWGLVAYLLPAALLAGLTLIAVIRLFALRARARVIIEPEWLSALAHAQRRMDFKSGAALLVSDALPSPISWGLARPVILLSEEAVTRAGEAEAIIAHELAHVASMDWAKLILGRLVAAIYWFNPLVWMLTRDAHQLREEAADDAVLAANVEGTDYAALLVHTARHDCRAAMLAAHGVAPGKGSLNRRVHRVLDRSLPRTRMEARWAVIGALVALLGVAPLAALTLAPKSAPKGAASPASLKAQAPVVMTANDGGTVTILPPDSNGKRFVLLRRPDGSEVRFPYDGGTDVGGDPSLSIQFSDADRAELASHGVSELKIGPDGQGPIVTIDSNRMAALAQRSASEAIRRAHLAVVYDDFRRDIASNYPPFARLDDGNLAAMQAAGVEGDDLHGLWNAGYRNLTPNQAIGAISTGVDKDFIAGIVRAGCRGVSIQNLTGMAASGVDGDVVRESGGVCSPAAIGHMIARETGHERDDGDPPPPPPAPPRVKIKY